MSDALTTIEQDALTTHEAAIERGLKTFVEVGNALLAIRDGRLYRASHGTFEDYCRERWSFTRDYANKLIGAAEVVQNLNTIVSILPTNEAQARPLASLPPEQQRAAWQESVATAPDGKITAAHVASVAEQYKQPSADDRTIDHSTGEILHDEPVSAPRRTPQERLAARPPIQQGTYRVILADPPWLYEVYSEDTGQGRSAEAHYSTMPTAEIAGIPVGKLAAQDCCLFMWATWPTLPDAFALGTAWGFDYKTCAFLWSKTNKNAVGRLADPADPANWFMGMGFWSRANTEPCLLFTRGNPIAMARDVRQLIVSPIGEHSQKPAEQYARIERLVSGPYIELFARQQQAGWDALGNGIDGLDMREVLR